MSRSGFLFGTGLLAVTLAAFGCQSSGSGRVEAREVSIKVTDAGFEPRETTVSKGENVTLVFTRETEQTCAKDVVVKERGNRKVDLPLNQPVKIALGKVDGKVTFACGMDMVTGQVVTQ